MAIKITLENTAEYNPNDYVSVFIQLDEESTWMDIVEKIIGQGLPALGYVIPEPSEKIKERLFQGEW
jgi:hypothetical protein